MHTKMKAIVGTAMIFVGLTMAGNRQMAAPATDGSFEQFWADAQKEKRADKSEASQKRMAGSAEDILPLSVRPK